ncbi:class I lanthipeptide [Pedobacter lusitanus]|uniref:class I lanthipeptide n=1 Tax=Pedobacter lusitanus TaxID=1503925 RepID=UPI000A5A68F0|nr:class I lanthipeptide [Pedobacter lusitanus]
MKKIKLNSERLRLKKEKVASLTTEQMSKAYGGIPVTTATRRTCCDLTDLICPEVQS